MSMLDKISEDLKTAMKAGDKTRMETLRTLRAGLLEKQVEKRPTGGMTTEDELAVVMVAGKKRKEAIEVYKNNNRNDLAQQEEAELQVIQEYLPKQLSPEDVKELVKKVIAEVGATSDKDFGNVMGPVMKELKGKADGKLIQETVKSLLSPQ
ncbi:MAG: GatB/YqeY domain-containing protein [Ignavibacteriae bacterium]|nr:GatB/YqeY domain-containing protein [Ignavibacteriota bacterium]